MGLFDNIFRWLQPSNPRQPDENPPVYVSSDSGEQQPATMAAQQQPASFIRPAVQRPYDWRDDLPPTFGMRPADGETEDDLIYDPATRNYARAFRRGDPRLPEPDMVRWHAARRAVMRHLAEVALNSEAGPHLVVRGSLPLRAALGADAREPGDIDWVVQPANLIMDQPEGAMIINAVLNAVSSDPVCGDCTVDVLNIARTDIWTYDRAPGHRLAFPWQCGNLPPAVVQMDFVFQQTLYTPPQQIDVPFEGLAPLRMAAASEAESLAWKILWLFTDDHPQGKDLYDAALLAERADLPAWLLRNILEDAKQWDRCDFPDSFPLQSWSQEEELQVDWANFLKECPWIPGMAERWLARLQHAISPAVTSLRLQRAD